MTRQGEEPVRKEERTVLENAVQKAVERKKTGEVFLSDPARIVELERYAKSDLPPTAAKDVAKAVDEVGFRAELKPRLLTQIASWISEAAKGH